MSSTSATAARCTSCRELRDPSKLLLVFVDGRPAYSVCRPSLGPSGPQYQPLPCFRIVGPAATERIEPLSDYLRREQSA